MTSPRGLHALARLHGIQTAYHDNAGRRIGASPESLMAALRALGVPVQRAADIAGALDRRHREIWRRVVEPVVVTWLPDSAPLELRLPAELAGAAIRITVELETGGQETVVSDVAALAPRSRRELGGRVYLCVEAPLPRVPAGYHDLIVEVGVGARARVHRARLIAAPKQVAGWETLPGGAWGVFAPLYSLWEESDPDRMPHFGLLAHLADGVARSGGGVVGTLPLLSTFMDRPYEPSPYAPVSRLFWNELYVDVGGGTGWRQDERMVDPERAMAIRRVALEAAARDFFRDHEGEHVVAAGEPPVPGLRVPRELAAFIARSPRAPDYARFRALTEARGPWRGWPARIRARDVRADDFDMDAARYHLYVQWQAERQLAEAEEGAAARGVALYLDLPLGVHRDGYDVWRERDQFATAARAGAPPDPLAPGGQDWGFHPLHPETSRLDGHRYFIASIRAQLRFARVLRIDHIMQLHRLFWVLDNGADGVYVRYPHDELYAILSLESHRAGAVIVGEDLGTVPRTVRRSMRRHGLPGMYVVQFELEEADGSGRAGTAEPRTPETPRSPALRPRRVPPGALASIGTHDTPMFAAWWTGRDAEIRGERGLMDPVEARAHVAGRGDLRDKLARGLGVDPGGRSDSVGLDVQAALYRFLGRSRAGLVLASLEDLWMETEPQNVPGTPTEQNWRQRARRPLGATSEGTVARLLATLNEAREGET